MKLRLKRIAFKKEYTIGRLYVDGVYFCDTLEDKVRDLSKEEKVMHETAIPAGTYKVIVNMSNRFKKLLPLILDVPYFTGIRIHGGNNHKHTSGCPLVGKNTIVGGLTNSSCYSQKLTGLIQGADSCTITIE